jgi:LPXTG-motif cell wall-anchored protein
MRRSIVTLALATALLGSWALPAEAQQNGLVIQNNGVDSVNSAAGADNVRISRAPGNSSSANGGGAGNQERHATGEAKRQKNRKDRSARNNDNGGGGGAAPAEAAPEGDLQSFADESAAPAAAPETAAAPQETSPTGTTVLRLPSTGSGMASSLPLAALMSALAAGALGLVSLRRRWAR